MKAKKDNRLVPLQDYASGNEDVNMNNEHNVFMANPTVKCMYVGQESRTGTHDANPIDDGIAARPLTQFQNIPGPALV